MKKFAFTMLELVFVIMIIGIIAALVIPRIDRDNRFEAANQVVNHIKYTQHLAMTQDVYNDININWFLNRWQVSFYPCGAYSVVAERDGIAGVSRGDAAIDPQTGKSLFVSAFPLAANACDMPTNVADYEKMNLSGYFDVTAIGMSAGCGGNNIVSFDTLGRPYGANTINGVIKANCDITLTFGSGNPEIVRIHPETGYACILNAAGDCL